MATDTIRLDAAEVESNGRAQVEVGGAKVVVFSVNGEYVAYHDVCPHQGGPVCTQGALFPFLTARVEPNGTVEEYYAEGGKNVIACPWHGWEFSLRDGQCLADRTKSLRAAKVTKEGEQLVVTL
jgi:nitrite reductase (NADH) small subunit